MLQPVSVCNFCACCGLSLILETLRVLGALLLIAHVLELCFLGEPFYIIPVKHSGQEHSKTGSSIC